MIGDRAAAPDDVGRGDGADSVPHPAAPPSRRILLAALALSGGAALVYEVTWTRALSLVLGSTTYAVSTMLATFMAGLAVGAAWGGGLADRRGDLVRLFAWCELGIGIAGTVSIPLIYQLPRMYFAVYSAFHDYPVVFFVLQTVLCVGVMALPTVLMGATFPLAGKALAASSSGFGRVLGTAYSVNTVGAVVGSVVAGFVLVPWLGLKGATMVAGALNLVVGCVLLVAAKSWRSVGVGVLGLAYCASIGTAWAARRPATTYSFYEAHRYAAGEPFSIAEKDARNDLTLLSEGFSAEGEVRAFRSRSGRLLLQVGGKIEGTDVEDVTNTLLLAYLPAATHESAKRALVVGLGAGVTLSAAKETVPEVDCVEIHPGVIEAVRQFAAPGLLDGVRLVRDDARRYLATSPIRYDVISSEPSYPTDSAVANLFSLEYYRLAANRLAQGGVYAQWLPYYLLSDDDVTMALRTFVDVFPHATLWKVPGSLDLIVVGSRDPLARSPDQVRAAVDRMNRGRWRLDYVLSRGEPELAALAERRDVPLNTDDHPRLEFRVARNLLSGRPGGDRAEAR